MAAPVGDGASEGGVMIEPVMEAIKRKTVVGRPGIKMPRTPRQMLNQPKPKSTYRIQIQDTGRESTL